MSRWSLRTRLAAVVAVACLPFLGISAWHSYEESRENNARRASALDAAVELAVSRHRELIEGSRRLLGAACTNDVVRRSTELGATPAELERCEDYLGQVMQRFGPDYSAAVVTDDAGVARCSSAPSAAGLSLGDREIFQMARAGPGIVVGSYIASRVTPRTIVPVAMAIRQADRFLGMCALGISLERLADFVTSAGSAHGVSVVLADRSGAPVGGSAEAAFALPVAARIAAAIARDRPTFSEYGQNGTLYDLNVRPLTDAVFAVAAVPVDEGILRLWDEWGSFALIVVATMIVVLVVWVGADRWAVQPLREIRQVAERMARGEEVELVPTKAWGPEMMAVGEGVRTMAQAIASRETALHAGLEQRDHMLREIHHRVKNNLQMISSLLNLQAGEIRSPRIRRYFADAQNRVLTLSILHRHLYERSSWSLVDFQQFISDLVRQLSVGRPGVRRTPPRFHIRAPIMAVGPDTAIPVGLIITEAVSSVLGHDFSAVGVPEVRIDAVEKDGRDVELVIEDNGRPREGAIGGALAGFGLTLIRGLAMQLGGEARVLDARDGGTRLVVTFPLPGEEERNG
jgi:two-component sensor histidine kinase